MLKNKKDLDCLANIWGRSRSIKPRLYQIYYNLEKMMKYFCKIVASFFLVSNPIWAYMEIYFPQLDKIPSEGEIIINSFEIQEILWNKGISFERFMNLPFKWQQSTDGETWEDIGNIYDPNGGLMAPNALMDWYRPDDPQVNHSLRFILTGRLIFDNTNIEIVSNATDLVQNINDVPSQLITIKGSLVEKETLILDLSSITDPDGLGVFSYQWQSRAQGADWDNINDQTGPSLFLNSSLIGKQVRVILSYIDGHGTAESIESYWTKTIQSHSDPATPVQASSLPVRSYTVVPYNALQLYLGGSDISPDGVGYFGLQNVQEYFSTLTKILPNGEIGWEKKISDGSSYPYDYMPPIFVVAKNNGGALVGGGTLLMSYSADGEKEWEMNLSDQCLVRINKSGDNFVLLTVQCDDPSHMPDGPYFLINLTTQGEKINTTMIPGEMYVMNFTYLNNGDYILFGPAPYYYSGISYARRFSSKNILIWETELSDGYGCDEIATTTHQDFTIVCPEMVEGTEYIRASRFNADNGEMIWSRRLGRGIPRWVKAGLDEEIYIGGNTHFGLPEFYGGVATDETGGYILKLSSDGSLRWVNFLPSAQGERLNYGGFGGIDANDVLTGFDVIGAYSLNGIPIPDGKAIYLVKLDDTCPSGKPA